MSDDKRLDGSGELDSSLEDLLSLAFMKKKENQTKSELDFILGDENNSSESRIEVTRNSSDEQVNFDTSSFDVDEIAAATSYKNTEPEEEKVYVSNVRKITPKTDGEYDDYEDDYDGEEEEYYGETDEEYDEEAYDEDYSDENDEAEEELSIEEMVAKAMSGGKNGNVKYVERVATEDDAISDDELAEILSDDEMYNSFVNDDEPEKPKWYKNKKIIAAISVLSAFVIIIGVLVGFFLHYYGLIKDDNVYVPQPGEQSSKSDTDTVDADDYEEWLRNQLAGIADNAMSNENVTNILIIAEDLRDTTGDSRGNTDVMILASINKERETITLTSFMRDIYCDIPGYYAARLNSAYAKGGPEVLMNTLQANFGVVVDRYVLVNFYSFMEVVEAIGGIEADVTDAEAYAMKAPMAEQNNILGNPKGTDYLPSGGHYNLNGNQALGYARIRKGVGDDFGRTRRQREVIYTALNKAKNLSLSEIKKLADNILESDMVKTNLTQGEVASLLMNCFTYMDYEQQQLQVPADGTWSGMRIRGMEVLSVNYVKNIKLIQETIYGETNVNTDPNSGEYTNTFTTTQKPWTNAPTNNNTTTKPPQTTPATTPYSEKVTTPKPQTVTTTTTTVTTTVTTTPKPTETTPESVTASETTTSEITTTTPPEVTDPPPESSDASASSSESIPEQTDPPAEITAAE